MRTRHADRLWIAGGFLAAALLLAFGWFIAISPAKADADAVREQTATTEIRLVSLQQRLTELQEQAANLNVYQAALQAHQAALPTDSGLPDFLRQLERSGDAVNITVSSLTVGPPVQSTAVPSVYDLPITVTAEGSGVDLNRFLEQVQTVQPRAVLIKGAILTSAAGEGAATTMNLVITMTAFVATGR
jgi:Tfp pilus assembly protein PilO